MLNGVSKIEWSNQIWNFNNNFTYVLMKIKK